MTTRRSLSRVAVFAASVLAALAPLIGPTSSATADDDPGQTVSWSVRPADESGPDGRAWSELELDPGETTTERMAVVNLGESAVTFSLTGADGYFTRSGRFNMLPSGEESTAAGTWIDIPASVTVEPGATAVVPFRVVVPADATPGDHAAGVAASIRSEGSAEGNSVGVESRVGFRVMVRVAGEVEPALDVSASGDYVTAWNPLDPGAVVVRYTLRNAGNVRLETAESVQWNGRTFTAQAADDGAGTELLPGDERVMEIRVDGVWPLGPLSVPLAVEQAVILPDGSRDAIPATEEVVGVWAVPWPQLLVLLAVGLIVGGLVWRGRRRRREVETLVNAAREEGRREAQADA